MAREGTGHPPLIAAGLGKEETWVTRSLPLYGYRWFTFCSLLAVTNNNRFFEGAWGGWTLLPV